MIELYRKINDRTINKTVKKIMSPRRKDDWQYFRMGVEMRGGDLDLAKDIIIRELEFMNTKSYDELLSYNPKKFMEALGGTRWSKSALECYPGASQEYMYIGKYLSKHKDEDGLLDMSSVNKEFEELKLDISGYSINVCKNEIKTEEGIDPNFERNNNLLVFFPHASEVFICDESKTIAVFFEFRVMFYEPKAIKIRLDSWRYDPKYYIKDEVVLNRQLNKIKSLREKLSIPEINDSAGFIYWANTDVTKDEIQRFLRIYNSIGCGSLQYFRESKKEILKSELAKDYEEYSLRSVMVTYDPFTENKNCRVGDYKILSDDFSNNQTYKELYE